MANGRKGKASKRKLDMREESGKLARQIGDRIQELRERIKDGDGRPITQPAFYDFIFDKPEYHISKVLMTLTNLNRKKANKRKYPI